MKRFAWSLLLSASALLSGVMIGQDGNAGAWLLFPAFGIALSLNRLR